MNKSGSRYLIIITHVKCFSQTAHSQNNFPTAYRPTRELSDFDGIKTKFV